MSFLGCNILGSKGVGSAIFQPLISLAKRVVCNTSTYYNSVTGETVTTPFMQVDGEPTLGTPATSIDRYIGNDTVNSVILLNQIGFCHLDNWIFEFTVNAKIIWLYQKIYSEGDPNNADHFAVFQSGPVDTEMLFIQIRNTEGSVVVFQETIPIKIFDGITHK